MAHDDQHGASRGPDVQQPDPGDSTDEAEIEVNPELHPSATDDLPEVDDDAGGSGGDQRTIPGSQAS